MRKRVPPRMHMTEEDYDVFGTIRHDGPAREEPIGSVWLDPFADTIEATIAPWKWSIDTTRGGTDRTGWWSKGRARTREEAMSALRDAWDTYQPKRDMG